ncbi:hypothetical protein COT72_00820 [archaeon CG10_big_fil_rev_8_21_14_0_10_43_11]|nr:MAG: hypothetical protein COT72_00820 [archaeon CG10_big_fil_rev_8_21_14_0_10_43_11]
MKQGILHIYTGPMGSNKTSKFIERFHTWAYELDNDFAQQKLESLAFKPDVDTRFFGAQATNQPRIVSRTGMNLSARVLPVFSPNMLIDYIQEHEEKTDRSVGLIAIDEVQFYDPSVLEELINTFDAKNASTICVPNNTLFLEVIDELKSEGINVLLSALNKSFRGEPWPIIGPLFAHAERIDTLTAKCTYSENSHQCLRDAYYTQRLVHGAPDSYHSPLFKLGSEKQDEEGIAYTARCEKHFSCLK